MSFDSSSESFGFFWPFCLFQTSEVTWDQLKHLHVSASVITLQQEFKHSLLIILVTDYFPLCKVCVVSQWKLSPQSSPELQWCFSPSRWWRPAGACEQPTCWNSVKNKSKRWRSESSSFYPADLRQEVDLLHLHHPGHTPCESWTMRNWTSFRPGQAWWRV